MIWKVFKLWQTQFWTITRNAWMVRWRIIWEPLHSSLWKPMTRWTKSRSICKPSLMGPCRIWSKRFSWKFRTCFQPNLSRMVSSGPIWSRLATKTLSLWLAPALNVHMPRAWNARKQNWRRWMHFGVESWRKARQTSKAGSSKKFKISTKASANGWKGWKLAKLRCVPHKPVHAGGNKPLSHALKKRFLKWNIKSCSARLRFSPSENKLLCAMTPQGWWICVLSLPG